MRTRIVLPSILLLLLATLPAFAQQFSSLEERMSSADFKAAGLDKLSPDELKNLDNWLQTHQQVKMVGSNGKPVFYADDSDREKFETHLVGTFSGWSGSSEFTLNNGQVWKQAESGAYSCPTIQNPTVTIKPMLLGSWLMYVQGCNDSVRVERVK
ncbi:MAG TPA: hypothetical protein VN725_01240 [Rhodanobacteraceae bacterium]|nr:hypothetical protein [Rhodanobacteraceae bacterium]